MANYRKFIKELEESIKERTNEDCPSWLKPAVRTTAMQMMMLDRLQEELSKQDLTSIEVGSQGQQKVVSNPLLTAYKECQRTLNLQLTSLGITYNATPSKLTESTKKGIDESDPLQQWGNAINN